MKNTDDKFEHLVEKLSRQKPDLQDAELLTNSIMQHISINSQRKKPKLLIWVRVISSSAAIFLLGLFLFQQTGSDPIASTTKPNRLFENKLLIDPGCIQLKDNNKINLLKTYYCYMKQNSIKNEQLNELRQQLTN
ncbi:MAG: hypothetical protein WC542_04985 [Paludibacter sp.]